MEVIFQTKKETEPSWWWRKKKSTPAYGDKCIFRDRSTCEQMREALNRFSCMLYSQYYCNNGILQLDRVEHGLFCVL